MPTKGGRPCIEKRAKRVFRQVKGGFALAGCGAAPHIISAYHTARSIFPAEGDLDDIAAAHS